VSCPIQPRRPPEPVRDSDGTFLCERWTTHRAAQRLSLTIAARLAARFGDSTKTAHNVPLSRGLIGVATDHVARQLVIVVDPARVDRQQLRNEGCQRRDG
jgi:hypothetical protein